MAGDWIDSVLSFWFEEIATEDWFKGNGKLDETIRPRFGALHERLSAGAPKEAAEDARAALAAVILFDQFPRNMFRGTAKAFSTDDLAIWIAREAVEKRLDEGLSKEQRQFLYMPFQHSEVLADQEHAVMLFKALGDEEALRYAVEHRDIIERFGRFPHRNRALGRVSTHDEEAFLEGHKGFGQ
ncbi:DUF924 family protein [Chelativorans xinjiangense]|uniref:DUF924 family protein n=1 Tax=Chelativorans xinjiangense TaxID=2681485 RepID=UPI0013596ABF|nr:DUF924 family protein [Chelativorans xinjiangense]